MPHNPKPYGSDGTVTLEAQNSPGVMHARMGYTREASPSTQALDCGGMPKKKIGRSAAKDMTQWKTIRYAKRRAIIRLAQAGRRHPNVYLARATASYAHDPRWDRLANRMPGWILPAASIFMMAVCATLSFSGTGALPTLVGWSGVILAFVALICGLLGWMSVATATLLRKVYPEHDQSPLCHDTPR